MSDWQRQPGLACEFCGGPGFYFLLAPPVSVVYGSDESAAPGLLDRRVACPEHYRMVRDRAERVQDPARFAHDHGRPDGWGETNPERLRRSLGALIDRLREFVPVQAAELEEKARDKGLL